MNSDRFFQTFWPIRWVGIFILLASIVLCGSVARAGTTIKDIRTGDHVGITRLVVNLSHKPDFTHFALDEPRRVVLDIDDADWDMADKRFSPQGVIRGIRYGRFQGGKGRIVIELAQRALPQRVFVLPPAAGQGFRLVLDLKPVAAGEFAAAVDAARKQAKDRAKEQVGTGDRVASIVIRPRPDGNQAYTGRPSVPPARPTRTYVVVIDPGHGGVDPGAIGKGGTREKNVVLSVALKIRKQFAKDRAFRIVLTRSRDTFIPLRQRIAIARNAGADLFLSLHADSVARPTTRGAGVYTLSERASDKEAASLARKENRVDLIAGIDLSKESDEVTSILIDLAQRETMNLSAELAEVIVRHLRQSVRVRTNPHRFAGFVVLKAPDVPSALIELGFLSNRTDENLLRTTRGQNTLALALTQAIRAYGQSALKSR